MHYTMIFLDFLYKLMDLRHKLRYRLTSISSGSLVFSTSTKSDSESTPYVSYVSRALTSPKLFKKFRKSYSYRAILEHVDYKLGKSYLEGLNRITLESYASRPRLQVLNKVGSPRLFYYKGVGWTSPTVLRYLLVNQNLSEFFEVSKVKTVGEIGIGFGGQFVITSSSLEIHSYGMYDLPEVIELCRKVLHESGISSRSIEAKEITPLASDSYDLVISNYAFSELPYLTQIEYITKIFANSKRGYLTMNSGRSNYSGRSDGKMTLDEILPHLPACEVIEENPQTGPDNYILVWGHKTKNDL